MVLRIDHRIGAAPAGGDVLGRWELPRGRGALVAVLEPGAVLACWWTRRPRSRRLIRWYTRQVVPELHATLCQRCGLDGASVHVFAPSVATATTWAAEFAAAAHAGLH
jgi:hypothetical protein